MMATIRREPKEDAPPLATFYDWSLLKDWLEHHYEGKDGKGQATFYVTINFAEEIQAEQTGKAYSH